MRGVRENKDGVRGNRHGARWGKSPREEIAAPRKLRRKSA